MAAIDKGEQELDFDEAGASRCVDSFVCCFMSLHPLDVPTWQEFVSKVWSEPELCGRVLNPSVLVAFGY